MALTSTDVADLLALLDERAEAIKLIEAHGRLWKPKKEA
jgi:hypothetical protein